MMRGEQRGCKKRGIIAIFSTLPEGAHMVSPLPAEPKSPAEKVIDAFGGVRATARALGRNPSSISRWRRPQEEGGTGGRVPGGLQAVVLQKAREAGLYLTADDLIGRARL